MDRLLKNSFKVSIETRTGFEFEKFVDELYLLKYGSENCIPIRNSKDMGNDGTVLIEKKVLACYAPKKYDKSQFQRKIQTDFKKYETHWKSKFPNWEVLVNHEISPEQLRLIDTLSANTQIKGIDQILHIIENDLNHPQRRRLAVFFGIEDHYKEDYIKEIIEHLLNQAKNTDFISYKKSDLVPIQKKIEVNFDKEDWDGIKSEINTVVNEFKAIESIIRGYRDNEKDLIKRRIMDDFNKLGVGFKKRLYDLTEQYTKQYSNIDDDGYKLSIKAVLLYMFEQCLVGKKPN